MNLKKTWDVIILGAGAAGLMCAIHAGRRGRAVAVLEKNERIGKKILISGGGRCNFTNLGASAENYISACPDFCKSALARYTPEDFLKLVEAHDIAYHEKKLGQQFCNDTSRRITDMLAEECQRSGVNILTQCEVRTVEKPDMFRVETSQGIFESPALVVATGGLSFPQLGSSDLGYQLARQFGLRVTQLRPALVGLKAQGELLALSNALSGVSIPVEVSCNHHRFAENLLFTHRGLSGPAILQISSYWQEKMPLKIHLLPTINVGDWLKKERSKKQPFSVALSKRLPRAFAQLWSEHATSPRPWQQWSSGELEEAVRKLSGWEIFPTSTEGYEKAEVTLGGVDTAELSSKTMESRKVKGLYFIGEVVDVTGQLGGYNFQWAWASGHAAGQAL